MEHLRPLGVVTIRGRRPSPSTISLLAIGGFALLLAACGGGRDDRVQSVLDDPDATSPLALLFGVAPENVEGPAQAESAIADCMARAGFDYEPITEGPGGSFLEAGVAPDEAAVRASGYGIADDLEIGVAEFGGTSIIDPNEEIRAGLSPEQLAAYEEALTGISPDEITFRNDGTPVDPETGEVVSPAVYEAAASDGCAYQAYAPQINASSARLLSSDVYAEVQSLIQSDPEMLELVEGWRRCMNDAGYPFRNQGEIFDELATEGDDIYHEATEDHHDVDDAETDERIDALRKREIAIAIVDWECSQPLFDATPLITRRIERAFIIDNEDRLLDLLDADA